MVRKLLLFAAIPCLLAAQIDLTKQVKNNLPVAHGGTGSATAAGARTNLSTGYVRMGTTLPASCTVGDLFFDTDATAGSNWYGCTATDTWTLLGDGSGGSPTFDQIVTGSNTTASMTVGTGASLGTSGTGTIAATSAAAVGTYTVATLPTGVLGKIAAVTDGSYQLDCTTGSGSSKVYCWYDGTAWVAIGNAAWLARALTQAVDFSTQYQVSVSAAASGLATVKTPVTINPTTGAIAGAASVTTGDGTIAGRATLKELTANGTNFRRLYVPDALTADLSLLFPNAVPGAAGGYMFWGAPATDISTGAFHAPSGTGTTVVTTTGTQTSGDCVEIDANGNHVASGTACVPTADPVFTGSVQIPNGTGPTIDAAGEIGVDTTTDQLQFYGGAKRALPTLLSRSFVIMAPVATDDFVFWKTPDGITVVDIQGVLAGTTNVVGQLQECDAAGANCADVDSDITFDGGQDEDDGTLTNGVFDAGDWVGWKTTSVSGTPTSLTITFTYRVTPD